MASFVAMTLICSRPRLHPQYIPYLMRQPYRSALSATRRTHTATIAICAATLAHYARQATSWDPGRECEWTVVKTADHLGPS